MSSPAFVFVASVGHSGSTLLSMLLAGHSQIANAGQIKVLSSQKDDARRQAAIQRCQCGQSSATCPVWSKVIANLAADGLALAAMDLAHPDDGEFARQNLAFLHAFADATGRPFVVDSTKSLRRLERLLAAPTIDVRPIVLHREPRGVAYSAVKKGYDWRRATRRRAQHLRDATRLLADLGPARVTYEELVADSVATVGSLCSWLGLEAEPGQTDLAAHEPHVLSGNDRALGGRSNGVIADESWRDGLSMLQRAEIRLRWRAP